MTFDEWYQAKRKAVYGNLRMMDGDYELMEIAFHAGYTAKEDEVTLANPLNDMTEEEVELHLCHACGRNVPIEEDANPCSFCDWDNKPTGHDKRYPA